jgi:hypothetical protein
MKQLVKLFLSTIFFTGIVNATLITIDITGTIGDVSGSYTDALTSGQAINATFTYDTSELLAGPGSQTTPSTDPGHEFTSFYEFNSPPYGASVNIPAITASFAGDAAGVVVNDNMFIDGADLNNTIVSGTYDWIEILGSTTSDGPNNYPADGEEWTLGIFSSTSWFSDGSVIPDNLPVSYTPIMLGLEFDSNENEIGAVFVNIDTLTVIPEPSSALLIGFVGLSCAVVFRRRFKIC